MHETNLRLDGRKCSNIRAVSDFLREVVLTLCWPRAKNSGENVSLAGLLNPTFAKEIPSNRR